MTITILVCALAFACGAMLGRNLAAIGINSDNALQNYQLLKEQLDMYQLIFA